MQKGVAAHFSVHTTNFFIPRVKKLSNITFIALNYPLILPCKVLHVIKYLFNYKYFYIFV